MPAVAQVDGAYPIGDEPLQERSPGNVSLDGPEARGCIGEGLTSSPQREVPGFLPVTGRHADQAEGGTRWRDCPDVAQGDKSKAVRLNLGAETFFFCSGHCLHAYEVDPQQDADPDLTPVEAKVSHAPVQQ